LLLKDADWTLSIQVLQEFYVQATRVTRPDALTAAEARELLAALALFAELDHQLRTGLGEIGPQAHLPADAVLGGAVEHFKGQGELAQDCVSASGGSSAVSTSMHRPACASVMAASGANRTSPFGVNTLQAAGQQSRSCRGPVITRAPNRP
jgi:hypothetical protein